MHAGPCSIASVLLVTRRSREPGRGRPLRKPAGHWEVTAAAQTEGVSLRALCSVLPQFSLTEVAAMTLLFFADEETEDCPKPYTYKRAELGHEHRSAECHTRIHTCILSLTHAHNSHLRAGVFVGGRYQCCSFY